LAIQNAKDTKCFDVFNFGPPDRSLSVTQVLEIAAGVSNVKVKSTGATTEFHEAKWLDLDSKKANLALGWKPCYTQDESIRATISWWNEALTNNDYSGITNKEVIKYLQRVANE
jgi:nucleoside-diphosphate-sugar epimerase